MEEIKAAELVEEELGTVSGGVAHANGGRIMGTPFVRNGKQWYRVATGDSLGYIAAYFKTTPANLQRLNPRTIRDVNLIFPGEEIQIYL